LRRGSPLLPGGVPTGAEFEGGMTKEVSHVLISFYFGEFLLRLLTFREAMDMALLIMGRRF